MAYTWNPLDKSAAITLSNGNLTAASASNLDNYKGVRATQYKSSGKYYWEITTTVVAEGSASEVGVGTSAVSLSNIIGYSATGWSWAANGFYYHNNGSTWAGSALTDGAIICIALDLDNGKLWFGKNGTWNNSGNPETGTNPTFTGLSGNIYPMLQQQGGSEWTANFGTSTFAYSIPSGFLCIDDIEGSTTESATVSDAMVGIVPTEYTTESAGAMATFDGYSLSSPTTESAGAMATFDGYSLSSSTTESAEVTDTFGNERTAYGPTTESAEVTDSMDALHLVDSITESAIVSGSMEAAEIIRKRVRFPNLQGKHLSLKFTSATDGSFAIYYLRHKMFKTRELCSDQKHPNTQGSHIGIKLSNSGSDAFTLMYVSQEMQLVTS